MKLLQAFPKNIALYTEYALTAYSNDEIGTCFKVLERCLKHAATTPLLHIGKRSDKNQLAHLYRTYIELLVKTDSQQNRLVRYSIRSCQTFRYIINSRNGNDVDLYELRIQSV